jgi:integrase
MARPATGQVLVDTRGGVRRYALRFHAYGKRHYVTVGTAAEGCTREKARLELDNILADVRRGIWRPAQPSPVPVVQEDPSFHKFASRWFEARKDEWRPNTRNDYQWQLYRHLLPFFKDHSLSEITVSEVDRYRQAKVAEARKETEARAKGKIRREPYVDKNGHERRRAVRPLSVTSINKTITRLGQILEVAVEYGLIASNPAKGRRRRLKPAKPAAVWLDRAEHIEALLDAARELDRHALAHGGQDQHGGASYRRALLATLMFAGLRLGELTTLRWRDVDLAGKRITIRASKTDAGVRQVDLLPALHDELTTHKANASAAAPDDFVFASDAGTELAQNNIRVRTLERAVELANERLIAAGDVPLPEGLTPHKLRHSFASLLVAIGTDPGAVMDQLGHADAGFTLRVYRHGMRRDAAAKQRLCALLGFEVPTGGDGASGTVPSAILGASST